MWGERCARARVGWAGKKAGTRGDVAQLLLISANKNDEKKMTKKKKMENKKKDKNKKKEPEEKQEEEEEEQE